MGGVVHLGRTCKLPKQDMGSSSHKTQMIVHVCSPFTDVDSAQSLRSCPEWFSVRGANGCSTIRPSPELAPSIHSPTGPHQPTINFKFTIQSSRYNLLCLTRLCLCSSILLFLSLSCLRHASPPLCPFFFIFARSLSVCHRTRRFLTNLFRNLTRQGQSQSSAVNQPGVDPDARVSESQADSDVYACCWCVCVREREGGALQR